MSDFTTIELLTFILAILFTILATGFVLLAMKREVGKVFKLISYIVLPILAITCLFAVMFMRLNTFGAVLAYVVGFGIAVCCELIAFAVAYFACKKNITEE